MSNKHSDKQKNLVYLYMQVSNTQIQMYKNKEAYALGIFEQTCTAKVWEYYLNMHIGR